MKKIPYYSWRYGKWHITGHILEHDTETTNKTKDNVQEKTKRITKV